MGVFLQFEDFNFYSSSCAISNRDTVIITGGRGVSYEDTMTTVSVYSVKGWLQDLPSLNTGRSNHACSSYWSGERRVFIVTGGIFSSDKLDTTETLDTGSSNWVTSGAKLPRPMYGLRAANIDDRVLIFGGHEKWNECDDILEFKPDEDAIVSLGQMIQ